MLTYGTPPEFRGGVHLFISTAIRHRIRPEFVGSCNCVPMAPLPRVRRHRDSQPQGSSERVLPWQVTMDQLIFASLSHTHYWYEVGMLKVPAMYACVCICRSQAFRGRGLSAYIPKDLIRREREASPPSAALSLNLILIIVPFKSSLL